MLFHAPTLGVLERAVGTVEALLGVSGLQRELSFSFIIQRGSHTRGRKIPEPRIYMCKEKIPPFAFMIGYLATYQYLRQEENQAYLPD